jgi:hypothetical protein
VITPIPSAAAYPLRPSLMLISARPQQEIDWTNVLANTAAFLSICVALKTLLSE